MAEFCSCGSLMIGGKCSNKNCEKHIRPTTKKAGRTRKSASDFTTASVAVLAAGSVSTPAGLPSESPVSPAPVKSADYSMTDVSGNPQSSPSRKPKRTSRCVTYRLEDMPPEDLENLKQRENSKMIKPGF